jgi:lipopolysaccharide/colanic/teichoic acid biosynthesis glycosyltransferase
MEFIRPETDSRTLSQPPTLPRALPSSLRGAAALETLAPAPLPTVLPGGARRAFYYGCKRFLDVFAATTLLILLLPLLLLIALLIKLDSPGPVLFVQYRVGSRRRSRGRSREQRRKQETSWEIRLFPFYKFRTMFANTDDSLHREYIREFCQTRRSAGSDSNPSFKLKDDPRITLAGRILRKTSLDELPQLINVLRGDMSLVGPRPVPLYEVAHYEEGYFERLAAPPGISGLWQVQGRGRVPFEEMIRMDIEYARTASLWLDLKILLLTIPAVLHGHGAE